MLALGSPSSSLDHSRLLEDLRDMTLLPDGDEMDALTQPRELADEAASQGDPRLRWVRGLV